MYFVQKKMEIIDEKSWGKNWTKLNNWKVDPAMRVYWTRFPWKSSLQVFFIRTKYSREAFIFDSFLFVSSFFKLYLQ